MFLSIESIPLYDILHFLRNNRILTVQKDGLYTSALKLIRSNKARNCPQSVTDWIIANNLLKQNYEVAMYNASDILLASDQHLRHLSDLFKLTNVNKERIIRILGFMDRLHNDMNVFDLLPNEIIRKILLELNYKTIKITIELISKKFSKLDFHEILIARTTKGYPRLAGHCFNHHVPVSVVPLIVSSIDAPHLHYIFFENLIDGIDYLYDKGADLVKGDLIIFDSEIKYRNRNKAIFDGIKAINLDFTIYNDGMLPKQFRVIEDNVPIKYWQ